MAPAVLRPARVLAATAALLLAAACGSGDGGREDSPTPIPPATSTPSTPDTTTPPPESPATPSFPSLTATAPEDPAKAESQIRKNWQSFFSATTPLKDKTALIEDGEQYALMVQGFAQDERASQFRAHVRDVAFTSPVRADVDYTLSRQDQTVTNAPGAAVLQDNTWKISFSTLCALARYGADVPQAATCP